MIALTARAPAKDKIQGLETGLAKYLTEPINVGEASSVLNQAVAAPEDRFFISSFEVRSGSGAEDRVGNQSV